ncbi:MAG: AtpZ/AtpI family protein [Deltaproteobacteria bacterium]|nr:AtpZ/AtpI family protein [Deltaproteobacteria bacterium]
MESPKNAKNSLYVSLGVYGAMGFQLAASVVAGLFLGGWADKKWGSAPWLTLIGLILGAAAGFYNLFRILYWHKNR